MDDDNRRLGKKDDDIRMDESDRTEAENEALYATWAGYNPLVCTEGCSILGQDKFAMPFTKYFGKMDAFH